MTTTTTTMIIILKITTPTRPTTTTTNDIIIHESSLLRGGGHHPPPEPKRMKRIRNDENISKIAPSSIEYNSKHVVDPVDPDASPTIVLARTKNDPVVDMVAVAEMST